MAFAHCVLLGWNERICCTFWSLLFLKDFSNVYAFRPSVNYHLMAPVIDSSVIDRISQKLFFC